MQSKLNKMSSLINEFAEARIILRKGKIAIEYDWSEPRAKTSFDNFGMAVKKDYAKSKRKAVKKKKSK